MTQIHPAPLGKTIREYVVQIKICGLTRISDAVDCARLGAHAVGCVFFPKSPRHVSIETARDISLAVGPKVKTVGVFVNAPYETIVKTAGACRLSAVQLHGQESPALATRLQANNIKIIKTMFIDGQPSPTQAKDYQVSAYLVECSRGPLPGGNAMAWDYASVRKFTAVRPLILAGGLSSETISKAIQIARPNAIDVSSGVESRPGIKCMEKVSTFISTVRQNHQIDRNGHNDSIF